MLGEDAPSSTIGSIGTEVEVLSAVGCPAFPKSHRNQNGVNQADIDGSDGSAGVSGDRELVCKRRIVLLMAATQGDLGI